MNKLIVAGENGNHAGKYLSIWVDLTNSNDDLLWKYIIKDVNLEDIDSFIVEHNFYEDSFLDERFLKSEVLLTYAIEYMNCNPEYIYRTSFHAKRTKHDFNHQTKNEIFSLAVEQACLEHARNSSNWWQKYALFLLNSDNEALKYIVISGLILNPEPNISLILSALYSIQDNKGYPHAYELGCLLEKVAQFLSEDDLENIQKIILNIYENAQNHELYTFQELLIKLPTIYRLEETQNLLDLVHKLYGSAYGEPRRCSDGGLVLSPVEQDKLLNLSYKGLLTLFQYYKTNNGNKFCSERADGRYVGGSRSLAIEYKHTVSLNPKHFFDFTLQYWPELEPLYCEACIEGIAQHTSHRFGNLNADKWTPLSEPTSEELKCMLFSLLKKQLDGISEMPIMRALEALGNVVADENDIECFCSYLNIYTQSSDPKEGENDLSFAWLNSVRGLAATTIAQLAANYSKNANIPSCIESLLYQFAQDCHPAVRSAILRYLPTVQYYHPELGWKLFDCCVAKSAPSIWKHTYYSLYYADSFEQVKPYLNKMEKEAMPEAGQTWGMIYSLAFLSEKIEFEELLDALVRVNEIEAWKGAVTVFSDRSNLKNTSISERCLTGLENIMISTPFSQDIMSIIAKVFYVKDNKRICVLSRQFVECFFNFIADADRLSGLYDISKWLKLTVDTEPELALYTAELALGKGRELYFDEHLLEFMTILFRQAEENEESDNGDMLRRAINLQDALLLKGNTSIEKWLADAERP